MKTFSTKTLITLLAVVLAVYFGVDYLDTGESTEKIPALLAQFDPQSISQARISENGTTLRLYKDKEQNWRLDLGTFQPKADSSIVVRALNKISSLKPTRIISKNSQNWNQYQVDTSGIRAELFVGEKKVADVYLGGLVPSGRELMSYVRSNDSEITYSVSGFASESVSSKSYIYRPKMLAACFRDSIEKIVFQTQGGESFEVVQTEPKFWKIGTQNCDSASVNSWAIEFESLSSTDFVDGFSLETQVALIELFLKNQPKKIELRLFENQSGQKAWVSSLNPESSFEAEKISEKIMKKQKDLLKKAK